MADAPLGKLKYKDAAGYWAGYLPLPAFAALGGRPATPPPTDDEARRMIAEMNRARADLRGLVRARPGAAEEELVTLGRAAEAAPGDDAGPDPRDGDRERKRQARAERRAARLAGGEFPVRVADPDGAGPLPPQAAALAHLAGNEAGGRDAVLDAVWDSFRHAYGREDWRRLAAIKPAATPADLRGRFGLARVEAAREHRGGFAHLVFDVESDWHDEFGLSVVYSPDTRAAAWTARDGVPDLTPSDAPIDDAIGDEPPTPHDELLEAIFNGDEARARALAAAGADVNDLAPDEYPPLCMAVDELSVEEVRRLLAFGADPNIPDPDERKTPLKMAKGVYKEMGFGSAKKNDPLHDAMMAMAREAAGKQFDEMKTHLEAIIRLLEDAGGE